MAKLSMSEEEMLKRKYTRPYEKKIEELEQENNKLLDVINNQDVKIADLEKKNAELEADNDARKYAMVMSEKVEEQLREQIKQIEKVSDYNADQLTKAKEIISAFVEWANWQGANCPKFKDIQSKAEQFLKCENIILEDAQAGNSPFDADEVFNKEMKAYPEEKVK